VFQFFKNGRWQYVTIDTRIPYSNTTKKPLYGHCSSDEEFWVPLMEKAYAKLHKSYEALCGGTMAHGLVDLTGGVSEKINLTVPDYKELLVADTSSGKKAPPFFYELKKYSQLGYLLGCAISVKDENGIKRTHDAEQGQGNLK